MPTPTDVPIKPLIFSTRSIIAWQQGAKTQTRRLVRPQPLRGKITYCQTCKLWIAQEKTEFELLDQPYAVGDLLWIREGLERYAVAPRENSLVLYQADGIFAFHQNMHAKWPWKRDKLPAMFMPRWACRYYARVISVRSERLQDVSVEDCVAEGMPSYTRAKGVLSATPPDQRWWYIEWWEDLHKKLGTRWEDNPWVWVYGLEAVDASTD